MRYIDLYNHTGEQEYLRFGTEEEAVKAAREMNEQDADKVVMLRRTDEIVWPVNDG